jgi:hypothetical protein
MLVKALTALSLIGLSQADCSFGKLNHASPFAFLTAVDVDYEDIYTLPYTQFGDFLELDLGFDVYFYWHKHEYEAACYLAGGRVIIATAKFNNCAIGERTDIKTVHWKDVVFCANPKCSDPLKEMMETFGEASLPCTYEGSDVITISAIDTDATSTSTSDGDECSLNKNPFSIEQLMLLNSNEEDIPKICKGTGGSPYDVECTPTTKASELEDFNEMCSSLAGKQVKYDVVLPTGCVSRDLGAREVIIRSMLFCENPKCTTKTGPEIFFNSADGYILDDWAPSRGCNTFKSAHLVSEGGYTGYTGGGGDSKNGASSLSTISSVFLLMVGVVHSFVLVFV